MNNNPTKMIYVAKFGATWCYPCQQMHNYLAEDPIVLDNVIIEEIDVDENEKLANDLKVGYLPTVIVFDSDNKEIVRKEGFQPREDLINFIKQAQR